MKKVLIGNQEYIYKKDCNGETIPSRNVKIGRCIPEIIRVVEALQTADASRGSMPANWVPCEPIIVPSPRTFQELLARNEQIVQDRNGMSWYLSFKEPEKCITAIENGMLGERQKDTE